MFPVIAPQTPELMPREEVDTRSYVPALFPKRSLP
jgi:hypothetical protein